MAEQKTRPTQADVHDFIEAFVDNTQKRQDSFDLLHIMEEATGFPAQMWGPSIIGFGSYHYKYASGQEGDAPLVGFSPRKAAISLYVYVGHLDNKEQETLLNELGKHKMGKACIYIKKLSDIDQKVLKKMIQSTISFLKKQYPD